MKFLKVRDVKSPERGTKYSAGIDFFIPSDFNSKRLFPSEDVLIPSGLIVGIQEGTMLMAADKSGIASSKAAKIACNMEVKENTFSSSLIVGAKIIDQDYPGEVHIHLINVGENVVVLEPGMKIAQFIVVPILYTEPTEVNTKEELRITNSERLGGFGSTGVN